MNTPSYRVRRLDGGESAAPPKGSEHVVYWMIAGRRPHFNFALQRAVELAGEWDLPLIIFEPLRVGYQHASDRLHRFVIEGMRDHAEYFDARKVTYFPYVERAAGEGKGLLHAFAENAAAIVTDDYPCFFLPRMVEAAANSLDVHFEAVDNNGIYPMHDAERHFTRAHSFRRHLQKRLPEFLSDQPLAEPLESYSGGPASLPASTKKWKSAHDLFAADASLGQLPIDHSVRPVSVEGGWRSAEKALDDFVKTRLSGYGQSRNHPDEHSASGLSPWLHFGHLSSAQVFDAIVRAEKWSPKQLGKVNGSREGWWGMSESSEAYLDQIITWREIGFNACVTLENYAAFESLPDWAQTTLAEHAADPRDEYTLSVLENAETDDDIWNAAQRELTRHGIMQNYLRMLWGKKILQWSATPQLAAERMVYLNDKYALDGRDPNSYSGIYWVLGRYDRAWGPERPIFGKIRYMTSDSTRRKLRLKNYLVRHAK